MAPAESCRLLVVPDARGYYCGTVYELTLHKAVGRKVSSISLRTGFFPCPDRNHPGCEWRLVRHQQSQGQMNKNEGP